MKRFLILVSAVLLSWPVAAQKAELDTFLDNWHRAAARADAGAFFGAIADDGIYVGTDKHERWTRTEFIAFAKPYFDKGKAWDFKPLERDLHVATDGSYAWFSELLDTWMGVCRGSGILVRTDAGWRLKQYHLSVTVPNEVVGSFIKLVDEYNKSLTK